MEYFVLYLTKFKKKIFQADQHYPRQEEWKRKEQLYYQIITYFDRGKVCFNIIGHLNFKITNFTSIVIVKSITKPGKILKKGFSDGKNLI